jgi:hypothetical protein
MPDVCEKKRRKKKMRMGWEWEYGRGSRGIISDLYHDM